MANYLSYYRCQNIVKPVKIIWNHECTLLQKHPIAHAGIESDQKIGCRFETEM